MRNEVNRADYECLMDNYVYKYQNDLKIIGNALADVIELQKMKPDNAQLLMQAYSDLVYTAIAEIGTAIDAFYP